MHPIIAEVANILALDSSKYNYYLKNVCPVLGPTYDRIGIIDVELDDQVMIIDFPARGFIFNRYGDKRSYSFYSIFNDFIEPIADNADLRLFYEQVLVNKSKILLYKELR